MTIAPTPWTAAHDGHGGICLDDAEGRQIGFVSSRPEQDAHAELLKADPALLAAVERLLRAHYSDGITYSGDHPAAEARRAVALARGAA